MADKRKADKSREVQDRDEARHRRSARQRTRELTESEQADIGIEGVAGEADEASGTVPGSFGGTTGTSGRSGGIQTPGASSPSVRGIDPDEARGKVGRRRRMEEEM